MIDLEYDEMSPITGTKSVLIEAMDNGTNSYICMESGYVSNDQFTIGSEITALHETTISQLMRDVKVTDTVKGLVWYPAYIQLANFVLYCSGTSKEDLQWETAAIVEITPEEMEQYPVPGKEGEYFNARIDVENANKFIAFADALDNLYAQVQNAYHEHLETNK
jgi:hypothetical protein